MIAKYHAAVAESASNAGHRLNPVTNGRYCDSL
jgi:hypothetical protein